MGRGTHVACPMASKPFLTPGQVCGAYLSGSSVQGQEFGDSRACLSGLGMMPPGVFSLRGNTGTESSLAHLGTLRTGSSWE